MPSQADMYRMCAMHEALKKSGSSLTPEAKIDNRLEYEDDASSGVESYEPAEYKNDASSGVESHEGSSTDVESCEVSSTDVEWYESGGIWRMKPSLQTKKANATMLKHMIKKRDTKVRVTWSRVERKWIVRERWA